MAINTNVLKTYAPEARRAFIAAVKARAARFGITEQGSSAIREEGNVAIINGQPYPRSFAQQRRDLDKKIAVRGYSSVMEEVAYTWFNRFAAIRYMELHDYLDHGVRVLSNPNGGSTPEIVEKAAQVDLPGVKREQVVALKLDGTKDEELYRMLIVSQCNALHAVMPFLFEKIEDETELLLPDNLLHSESLVRQLVERIPEADWQHIEIIGWLYQFYISEKKDQVIGTVVKSEDIPAATQLFTPNWIVKFMVQNSLGAKWLATYPDSALRQKMEYYIAPGAQPPEVQMQIEAEMPRTLNPEAITFLDPASGSGHILVEAYELFREIYLERGYRLREIPRLILEKNLYGLDIDDRAAQLTGFGLVMQARADDRQILSSEHPVTLNVLSIQESKGLDAGEISKAFLLKNRRLTLVPADDLLPETLNQPVLSLAEEDSAEKDAISKLLHLFEEAKTFGSLISVPPAVAADLESLVGLLDTHGDNDDLVDSVGRRHAIATISPFVRQAGLLSREYDVVAANPPYMGSKGMNGWLKDFAQRQYPESKADLFAMFMERCLGFAKHRGLVAMINMQSWMFLSAYEALRSKFLGKASILSMAHLGERAFDSIGGAVVSTTAFVAMKELMADRVGQYLRLVEGRDENAKASLLREAARGGGRTELFRRSAADFERIPGTLIAYWLSENFAANFIRLPPLGDALTTREGLTTGSNDRFIRLWFEVSEGDVAFPQNDDREGRWRAYLKGGEYRRWSGNNEHVLDWADHGREILTFADAKTGRVRSHNYNGTWAGLPGLTWSSVSGEQFCVRDVGGGYMFDTTGSMGFVDSSVDRLGVVALLNSAVAAAYMKVLSPAIRFQPGHALKGNYPPLGHAAF